MAIPGYIFCILGSLLTVGKPPPKWLMPGQHRPPEPIDIIMKFDIKLSEDHDLTEFRRLLHLNDGAVQADYNLIIGDIILRVQVSNGALQYKNPVVLVGLALVSSEFPPGSPIMPRHYDLFRDIDIIQDTWGDHSYWHDMGLTLPDQIVDKVNEILIPIQRINKLKAFW